MFCLQLEMCDLYLSCDGTRFKVNVIALATFFEFAIEMIKEMANIQKNQIDKANARIAK